MTNQQALMNLFTASRQAMLKAEEHELLRKCAEQLEEHLKLPVAEKPATTARQPSAVAID